MSSDHGSPGSGRARRCAILAGGEGHRLGGGKPAVQVAGRPLLAHVVFHCRAAGLEARIVAKPSTPLPELEPLEAGVLLEPAEPTHPLLGLAVALESTGEALIACPCDLPLIGSDPLAALAMHSAGSPITVVEHAGRMQPLLGRFEASVAGQLREAVRTGESARAAVARLGAATVELGELAPRIDPERALTNVNSPADVAVVERYLAGTGSAAEPPSATR